MADNRLTKCQEHGGFFQHPVRRGRRSTRCKPEYPCSRARNTSAGLSEPSRVEQTASTIKNRNATERVGDEFDRMTTSELREYARGSYSSIARLRRRSDILVALRAQKAKEAALAANRAARDAEAEAPSAARNYLSQEAATAAARQASEPAPEAPKPANPCAATAMEIKSRLEPLGWVVKGRGWREGAEACGEVLAARGTENLMIQIRNGKVTTQEYFLWDMEKPSNNGRPASKLSVNTDEMTDREVIQMLAGSKVTWWNNLGSKEESAIVGTGKINIDHVYTGRGDETPSDRIIKFADHTGRGFRSFRLGALISIG